MDLSKLSNEQLEAYRALKSNGQPHPDAPAVANPVRANPTAKVMPAPSTSGMDSDGNPAWYNYAGNMPGYLSQIGEGVKSIFTPGQRQQGATNVLKGASSVAAPFAIGATLPSLLAAPAATIGGGLLGAGTGLAVSKGAGATADALGASPETKDLVETAAPMVLGPLATRGFGRVLGMPAKGMAEKAIGISANDKKFGADPGSAILRDTRGLYPETISKSADNSIERFNNAVEGAARARTATGITGSLQPARDVVDKARGLASSQNAAATSREMEPMSRFLRDPAAGTSARTIQPPTPTISQPMMGVNGQPIVGPNGQPIMTQVPGTKPPAVLDLRQSPTDLLNLRRGFNKDFGEGSTWTSNAPSTALDTARQAYHGLTGELHDIAPETTGFDKRIQDLIPVTNKADMMSRREGVLGRVAGRIERPTGGLASAAALGGAGGGLKGAAEGLGAMEMLNSPITRMMIARSLYGAKNAAATPAASRAARFAPSLISTLSQ